MSSGTAVLGTNHHSEQMLNSPTRLSCHPSFFEPSRLFSNGGSCIIVVSLVVVVISEREYDGSNRTRIGCRAVPKKPGVGLLRPVRKRFLFMVSWDGCQLDSSASSKTAQSAECLRRATYLFASLFASHHERRSYWLVDGSPHRLN